jgi:hypothetical protein
MGRVATLNLIFILTTLKAFSQVSDIISVQKRNGRNIKSFTVGSPFNFNTTDGHYVEGYINMIRDDSVFITSYDIRAIPNAWGVTSVDTLATYYSGFDYRQIATVQVSTRKRFSALRADRLLMDAGAGYFVLNLVNSNYLKEPFGNSKNIATLAISAGVFGLGLFLHTVGRDPRFSGKRDRIVYTRLR